MIAFDEGAVPEIIVDGETGFIVADEAAMAAAVPRLADISPADCRAWVVDHCDVDTVAAAYESAYRSVALEAAGGPVLHA